MSLISYHFFSQYFLHFLILFYFSFLYIILTQSHSPWVIRGGVWDKSIHLICKMKLNQIQHVDWVASQMEETRQGHIGNWKGFDWCRTCWNLRAMEWGHVKLKGMERGASRGEGNLWRRAESGEGEVGLS